jgi:magnesium-transporting ATPase (P-type)
MTVVYLDMAKGRHVAFMKGAPESVISVCTCDRTGNSLSDERKKEIIFEMESFAEEGLVISSLTLLIFSEFWPWQHES